MQSIQRFVNRFRRTFFCRPALANPANSNPHQPRNPCRCCVCSAVRVARGRILDGFHVVRKGFLKKGKTTPAGPSVISFPTLNQ